MNANEELHVGLTAQQWRSVIHCLRSLANKSSRPDAIAAATVFDCGQDLLLHISSEIESQSGVSARVK